MPFEKGKSGNPGGRPKESAEVKAAARLHGMRAIKRLAQLIKSKNERVAVAACEAMLNRGYGKPVQPIAGDDELPPMKVQRITRVIVKPEHRDR